MCTFYRSLLHLCVLCIDVQMAMDYTLQYIGMFTRQKQTEAVEKSRFWPFFSLNTLFTFVYHSQWLRFPMGKHPQYIIRHTGHLFSIFVSFHFPPAAYWPFLSVPYHSMGQIIKSVFVCLRMYVCMYVCICGHAYGRIFQPIFTKFGKNLWGLNRKNWLGWGQNLKMPSPNLAPKKQNLGACIGISSQICKNFKSSYLQNYTSD